MYRLAIFASGNGSNAQRIIEYFQGGDLAETALVLCNKPGATVLTRAANLGIPSLLFTREEFYSTDLVPDRLEAASVDLIVLAGFLWLVPPNILGAYPNRILNIHPALLPRHGGKGMYGDRVHAAVIAAGEKESGITIHYVTEHYDEGAILFQASCPVLDIDTPDALAGRIHALEHRHYPEIIAQVLQQMG